MSQRASEADQLFLTRGKAVAPLANRRIKALRKLLTKSSRFTFERRRLCRRGDLLGAQADVRGDSPGEQIRILQDHPK